MLGEAPGTDRLSDWVEDYDGGMSLEDIANSVAASDGFQTIYPSFSTNQEFAEAFLGNLMGGEDVPAALMSLAVGAVTGLLNDGLSRGALALAVVDAMLGIAADPDHASRSSDDPGYGLHHVADRLANQVEVAEHYTLSARMADSSSAVLENVTSDDATAMAAIEAIDNPPAPPVEPEMGQRYELTPTIDTWTGGDADDTIVAQPVQGADGLFNATLNSFDSIDGGGGVDTIHIFGVDPRDTLRLGAEDIMNVENVVITTVGNINANLSDWTGLESVTLDRFGREDETTVDVTVDGATVTVSDGRQFNGNVKIVGAAGAVNIDASASSVVRVGSAGHTETVMVEGGASVMVDNGAGKQSETVTSVSVDGVARHPGGTTGATDPDESGVREATISAGNSGLTPSEGVVQYVRQLAEGETPPSADTTDDGVTPVTAIEAALNTYYIADQKEDNLPEGVTLATGMILVTSDVTKAEGYVEGSSGTSGVKPTVNVLSDSIETVNLHNTTAIAAVINQSKMADGDDMPEDLAVTVDGYGSFQPWGAVKLEGKLCIGGSGSAENIEITVAGASAFDLASGAVKTIDISGDGRLVLGVDNFEEDANPGDDGVSTTLESVTVSGGGGVSMTGLSGMSSLTTIDASASSGNNVFRSKADADGLFPDADDDELEALTMVKGGSGKDTVALATSAGGELESIDTGTGDDSVTVIGMLRSEGLTVDLGAGDDVYSGRMNNNESRIDGGEGTDILHLTTTANSTYRDADNKVQSIYTGFETLNVALGRGDYDVEQLGIVNDVLATATTGSVTLENMADGMGIRVHGIQGSGSTGRSTDTSAMIYHESADDRRSDELDVHLLAQGRNDTRGDTKGLATLTLTTDDEIEVINISSNATAHSSKAALAAKKPVRTKDYENKLTLTSTAVEELVIDGNAKLSITVDPTATELDEVDAKDNSGGVTFAFSGTAPSQDMELDGGSGADKLTGGGGGDEISGGGGTDTLSGGDGDDEISGGAGGDKLTGGGNDDVFKYTSASQSQVAWTATDVMYGFDTITDFTTADDDISLGRTLFNGLHSQTGATLRTVEDGRDVTTAANRAIHSYDDDTGADDVSTFATANSLRGWLGNGNGVFETVTGSGLTAATTQYAITTVNETYFRALKADEDPVSAAGAIDRDGDGTNDAIGLYRTWILIDVNADGDFDASVDMAIAVTQGSSFSNTINLDDFGI